MDDDVRAQGNCGASRAGHLRRHIASEWHVRGAHRFLKRANNEPAKDALVLTTMRSSNRLEWDHVWITRAEENVVPDLKSPESEERRLFYVAMT